MQHVSMAVVRRLLVLLELGSKFLYVIDQLLGRLRGLGILGLLLHLLNSDLHRGVQ